MLNRTTLPCFKYICFFAAINSALLLNSCGNTKTPDEQEFSNNEELLSNFTPAYPTSEDVYLLLNNPVKGSKNKGNTQKELDHLWYVTTNREKYRRDNGTYDYEMLNADLFQTGLDTGIPVVRGDKKRLKAFLKRRLAAHYDERLTVKLFRDSDSVWTIYTTGKFNRFKTSWSSPSDTHLTRELGFSSNK